MNLIVHDMSFLSHIASFGVFELAMAIDTQLYTTDFAISALNYTQTAILENYIKSEALQVANFDPNQVKGVIAIMQKYTDTISITNASLIYLSTALPNASLITNEKPVEAICQLENIDVKGYEWFFKHFEATGLYKEKDFKRFVE